ncbi:hypothetical protein V2E29_04675 [Streptomyces diastatochromogenes]|uniref:hypothetical protein n=1 Tax=Streptomyces diastatochromogenes TaxID=42236 RepID=UPI002F26CC8B
MTHRQEREAPEGVASGPLSAPHGENGAQDAGMPERAAGGRVGPRGRLDAADINPTGATADCPACEVGIDHDVHCPTPESHNWGCGCPSDQIPRELAALEPSDGQSARGAT